MGRNTKHDRSLDTSRGYKVERDEEGNENKGARFFYEQLNENEIKRVEVMMGITDQKHTIVIKINGRCNLQIDDVLVAMGRRCKVSLVKEAFDSKLEMLHKGSMVDCYGSTIVWLD